MKYPDDFINKIICGDCLEVMKAIPDESINCCITSPPYWGLRDYGIKGQFGLEETPEKYIEDLVNIFREIKRILSPNGTVWLNLGDTYISKGLVGIPWGVAFALRSDGWFLRSDIIWHKLNPMPESVTDRPAKSHEYIFLLTKSEKYWYDYKAILVPQKEISLRRAFSTNYLKERKDFNNPNYAISSKAQNKTYEKLRERIKSGEESIGRNKRTVWEVNTAGVNNPMRPRWMSPRRSYYRPIFWGGNDGFGCQKTTTQIYRD